jgi:hypothetical protein
MLKMSIIFIGVKVLVTAGKYKGKTARIYSYKENKCRLIADGEFTTIQDITGRPVCGIGTQMPTCNVNRDHVVTLDWKTPPSSYFIRSNGNTIFPSLLKYCTEQYPEWLREYQRIPGHQRQSPPVTTFGQMMVFPVYSTYLLADKTRKDWLEEWWTLYCAAFHDQKPDMAIKIQSILRMHFKRKDYLEILSFKPDGAGYLEVKEEFEIMAASAAPPVPPV